MDLEYFTEHNMESDAEPTTPGYKLKYLWAKQALNEEIIRNNALMLALKTVKSDLHAAMQEWQAKGVQFGRSLYANELDLVIKENRELKRKLGLELSPEERKFVKE